MADFDGSSSMDCCRHHYSVRIDESGRVTVVNPTLGWRGQCPIAVKKSAVLVWLDVEPTVPHATTAILLQ